MRTLLYVLDCRFFPFVTLNISCHSLLACRVFAKKISVWGMGIPLYVICCFSLVALNTFCLYLIFVNLINVCLDMFLLGFILYGTVCTSWTWVTTFFLILGKISTIISSNIFSGSFSFSSFWTPII